MDDAGPPAAGGSKGWLARLAANDFARKVVDTYSTRVVLIGLSVIATVIVSRALGPEGRGQHAVASTLAALGVQFGNLGLSAANAYWAARDRTRLPALVGNSLGIGGLIGLVAGLVVAVAYALLPGATLSMVMLGLAIASVPINTIYLLLSNLVVGVDRIQANNRIELLMAVVGITLGLGLIAAGGATVERLFLIGPLTAVASCALILLALRDLLPVRPFVSPELAREVAGFSLRAYLSTLFMFCLLRVDQLQLEQMTQDPRAVGVYSAAVSLADRLYMLPQVVGAVLYPKLVSEEDPAARWALCRRITGGLALVVAPLALLLAAAAEPVVWLLFGPGFEEAARVLRWLLPGIVCLSLNTLIMIFIGTFGMPRWVIVAPAVFAAANLGLNLVAIPRLGAAGAALTTTICYAGLFATTVFYRRTMPWARPRA